jgi:hypothetical protein
MLVSELKNLIKSYGTDDLQRVILELYKAMPKQLRESKGIDQLLEQGPDNYKHAKRTQIDKPTVDIDGLKDSVEIFLDNAWQQNYMAPNRSVAKKDRPKWRFIVLDFFKKLQAVPADSDDGRIATDLMVRLYQMLCHACSYYLFRTNDPFHSVGIVQTETLDIIVQRILLGGITPARISQVIELVIDGQVDRETVSEQLIETALNQFKTPDLRELALAEASRIIEKHGEKRLPRQADFMARYAWDKKHNLLVLVIYSLLMRQSETDKAIQYFNTNYREDNKEILLYVLLLSLRDWDLKDHWLREFDLAVKHGVKPRPYLRQMHQFIQNNGRFPTRQERMPKDNDDDKDSDKGDKVVYVISR